MGRKSKYSFEIKVAAIKAYENNEGSQKSVAEKYDTNRAVFQQWWIIYQSQGIEGLKETHLDRKWDGETKLLAAQDYLSGANSMREIYKKYNISSTSILTYGVP